MFGAAAHRGLIPKHIVICTQAYTVDIAAYIPLDGYAFADVDGLRFYGVMNNVWSVWRRLYVNGDGACFDTAIGFFHSEVVGGGIGRAHRAVPCATDAVLPPILPLLVEVNGIDVLHIPPDGRTFALFELSAVGAELDVG